MTDISWRQNIADTHGVGYNHKALPRLAHVYRLQSNTHTPGLSGKCLGRDLTSAGITAEAGDNANLSKFAVRLAVNSLSLLIG